MRNWVKNHKKLTVALVGVVCMVAVLFAGAMQLPHAAHAAGTHAASAASAAQDDTPAAPSLLGGLPLVGGLLGGL